MKFVSWYYSSVPRIGGDDLIYLSNWLEILNTDYNELELVFKKDWKRVKEFKDHLAKSIGPTLANMPGKHVKLQLGVVTTKLSKEMVDRVIAGQGKDKEFEDSLDSLTCPFAVIVMLNEQGPRRYSSIFIK